MKMSWFETGARRLVTRFLARFIATGCLILTEEGGTTLTFRGTKRESSLSVCLKIHNPQFYWKIATESDIGIADAYISGDFTFVDKNEGLLNLFMIYIANVELSRCNTKLINKRGWWSPLLMTSIVGSAKYYLKDVLRRNTLTQARRNISRHYDLSNEFFSLFMDETMSYSSPIFKTPVEDLKDAQMRKIQTLIKKTRIDENHHILEIGFGWGSFAVEAVKQTGCRYTGITLSEKQLQYAQLKVVEAGLQDKVELLLLDYRQVPSTRKYDRIIHCEVLESVGHEYMGEFFRCCDSLLAENGLIVAQAEVKEVIKPFISTNIQQVSPDIDSDINKLVVQTTCISDHQYDECRLSQGFIKEYIFQGGCMPSLHRLLSSMAASSTLCVVHIEDIGRHYYLALRIWRDNLLKNKNQIMDLGFDERFIKTFEYYFDYCAAGFKSRTLLSYQIVFTRPGDAAVCGDPYGSLTYHG